MILGGYLSSLGYLDIPLLAEINDKSFRETDGEIFKVYPWRALRDVFDYVACMEHAVARIDALPQGKAIGSVDVTPARYDSAALVFFAQATLDNMAVWLNESYGLGLKATGISFYKNDMQKKLGSVDQEYFDCLENSKKFVARLNDYRMAWLHKLAGGADVYSDLCPSDPQASVCIMVPLDPKVMAIKDDATYIKRVEEIQRDNNGEWLMSVSDFAHDIKESTFALVLELLAVAVKHPL